MTPPSHPNKGYSVRVWLKSVDTPLTCLLSTLTMTGLERLGTTASFLRDPLLLSCFIPPSFVLLGVTFRNSKPPWPVHKVHTAWFTQDLHPLTVAFLPDVSHHACSALPSEPRPLAQMPHASFMLLIN